MNVNSIFYLHFQITNMMPRTMSPPPRKPGAKWPGFLINRSGLPFDELTWSELWEFAAYLYPGINSRID